VIEALDGSVQRYAATCLYLIYVAWSDWCQLHAQELRRIDAAAVFIPPPDGGA
jgi:hypothetical protein